MPIIDEIQEEAEERRYQEELARQQRLEEEREKERRRRQQAQRLARQMRTARRLGRLGATSGAAGAAGAGGAAAAGGTAAAGGAAAAGAATATAPIWGTILAVAGIVLAIIFLVFIILSALCNGSWAQRLGVKAVGVLAGQDFCAAFSGGGGQFGGAGATGGFEPLQCRTPQFLAQQNNVPYPRQNDPDLTKLRQCIESKVSGAGSIFTYDQSHDTCNYTRGADVCESCSHSQNSCHYGGAAGTTGALAVDYGNEKKGAEILQAAISCSASLDIPLKRATCESPAEGGAGVACADPGADHVHISIAKCDRDNGPIHNK